MPSSRSVRKTRIAISPRLATRTLSNMSGPYSPRRGPHGCRSAHHCARRIGPARGRALRVELPQHDYWATAVFCIAMTTDWLDGRLARRQGRASSVGTLLDPIADKILVLAVLVMLIEQGVAPAWMVAAIVVREVLVTGLRQAAIERGVVLAARDLGKRKTWAQAV